MLRFSSFALPRFALAYIGRHSAPAFALSILLGLALPQIAASLRPFIPVSIFCFIVLSFARANVAGVQRVVMKPARLGLILLWSTLLPPIISVVAITLLGAEAMDPALRLGIALMAAAPPLMASPAFALVVGLENSLALTMLVLGMVITPLVSPFLANLLAGAHVPLEPAELALRLLIFIGGGITVGLSLRRVIGAEKFTRWGDELNGVSVVLFFLFAIAAMDGVIDAVLTHPLRMAGFLALSILLNVIGFALTYLAMPHLGFNDRFSAAIGVGLRNMGLLIAPLITLVPKETFLYFALAQVPIYIAPLLLNRAKRWLEPRPAL
jgi:bile acid:Na+ symporter, BASS family